MFVVCGVHVYGKTYIYPRHSLVTFFTFCSLNKATLKRRVCSVSGCNNGHKLTKGTWHFLKNIRSNLTISCLYRVGTKVSDVYTIHQVAGILQVRRSTSVKRPIQHWGCSGATTQCSVTKCP